MFSIVKTIRNYIGQNQIDFAQNTGLTQPDLCQMEKSTAVYGFMEKYCRIANYTGIPVDAIMRNDFRQIPPEFFQRFPRGEYVDPPVTQEARLGREGEELIFHREKARLSNSFPTLSHLVLPYFKLNTKSPGYDILSFDDDGTPFALEVKVSELDTNAFRLTNNEHRSAECITNGGGLYQVVFISGFHTKRQKTEELTYAELKETFDVVPASYRCQRKPPVRELTGLSFHRIQKGLQQGELAQCLGMMPCNLSTIESGSRSLNAPQYLMASDILGVPVDALLKTYLSNELEVANEYA